MRSIHLVLIACQLVIVYSNYNGETPFTPWRDFYPDLDGVGRPGQPMHPTHEGMTPDLYHGCVRLGTAYRQGDTGGWNLASGNYRSDCLEIDGNNYLTYFSYINDLFIASKKNDHYDYRCKYTYPSYSCNMSDYSTSINDWLRHDSSTMGRLFPEELSMMGLSYIYDYAPRASLIPFIDPEEGGRFHPVPVKGEGSWETSDPYPGVDFQSTSDDKGVHVGNSPSVYGEITSNLMGVRIQQYNSNETQLPCWNNDTGVQDEVVAAACFLDKDGARYNELKANGTCSVLDAHEDWQSNAYSLTGVDPQCLNNARHYHRSLMHISNPFRWILDGGCAKDASWMHATCDQHGFHCLHSDQPAGCSCVEVRVNFLCYENKRSIAPSKSSKSAVIDGVIIAVVTIVMLVLALALMVFVIRRNSVQKHDYEKMLEKMANSVSEAAGDIGETPQ